MNRRFSTNGELTGMSVVNAKDIILKKKNFFLSLFQNISASVLILFEQSMYILAKFYEDEIELFLKLLSCKNFD